MTEKPKTRKLVASDLLNEDHPLYEAFFAFCGENPVSKRQARKFLQKYPQYREVDVEVS